MGGVDGYRSRPFTFQYGRLKTGGRHDNTEQYDKFTFQYGRLKTGLIWMLVEIMKLFTFQYGRLKTQPRKLVEGQRLQFTFQYGRLKTGLRQHCKARFEIVYIPIWTIKDLYPHTWIIVPAPVYIPIWTIKDPAQRFCFSSWFCCLHSNMDD